MGINIKDEDKPEIVRLRDALLTIQGNLSLQQLVALLTIGAEPNLSVNALAASLGIPQQSASRHIAFLTGRYQNDETNAAPDILVAQQISISDPRSRALHLTEAGFALIAEVVGFKSDHG
jgi:DNA-binding MarR family transcriptional regulator